MSTRNYWQREIWQVQAEMKRVKRAERVEKDQEQEICSKQGMIENSAKFSPHYSIIRSFHLLSNKNMDTQKYQTDKLTRRHKETE